MITKWYSDIGIVKGRPRHPQKFDDALGKVASVIMTEQGLS
jgi:hypothetical protein